MAFRSLVKNAVEKEKRRSTIRGSVLAKQQDEEQGDPTGSLKGIFSFGASGADPSGRRKSTYGWLEERLAKEERLSKTPTLAADQKADVDDVVGEAFSCKSAPALSLETTSSEQTAHCVPEPPAAEAEPLSPFPPAGLHTYKWAEARLSKSAALAGANWDKPEAYMDYVREQHRHSPPGKKRVSRPSTPHRDVTSPQELPPCLEQPIYSENKQTRYIHQIQESILDSRLESPTHKLETPKQAEAMAVTAAPPPGIDDSFPAADSKPRSAWEAEKPPAKCNCALM